MADIFINAIECIGMMYKVLILNNSSNDDIWEKIKAKEVRGFSIEGWFTDKLIEASKQKNKAERLKSVQIEVQYVILRLKQG